MYKNQLQELAQRSCFNLPSYACIREGPDHAPRFKASVNFNGEIFESPSYCTTLRQAEHSAAEVALNVLSSRGPSRSLTARVLDETGIYKNLLQETAHRAGLNLPVYTTVRSGPGHVPIFTCTVELAGMNFTGESAKTKKQAEKNAAIAAWSALKKMPNLDLLTNKEADNPEEHGQAVVARVLSSFKPKDVKRRDHSQTRRRMVRDYRDNYSSATSFSNSSNSQLYQNWSLMGLLMETALDGSTSTQKQNSFVSLLPPPPPPSVSKILPPPPPPSFYPSNRLIPLIQVKDKSQVLKIQDTQSPLEEHQRDEEEWLGGKADVIKKPTHEKEASRSSNSNSVYGESSIYSQFPLSTQKFESTQIGGRLFGSPNPSPIRSSKAQTASMHMGRTMYTGGFNPQRIAPAVQIRSVIPVCAAPPMRSNPPSMKETSISSINASPSPSSTTSMPRKIGEGFSSVFNNPQKCPTDHQLSYELNKLQL